MEIIGFCVFFLAAFQTVAGLGLKSVRFPENPESFKTRSLSNGYATDGNNVTNAFALNLLKVGLLGGYAVRKVKMFNDRRFLSRYRRSYWLGSRYYYLDNLYYLEARDTCAYRMNTTERAGLEYEDGVPIVDVIYQCQRYAQYCCGLDCCDNKGKRSPSTYEEAQYLTNGSKFDKFALNFSIFAIFMQIFCTLFVKI